MRTLLLLFAIPIIVLILTHDLTKDKTPEYKLMKKEHVVDGKIEKDENWKMYKRWEIK